MEGTAEPRDDCGEGWKVRLNQEMLVDKPQPANFTRRRSGNECSQNL